MDGQAARANVKILGGRFVLAIKNFETNHQTHEARLVVPGHEDREKKMISNTESTIRQNYVRIVLNIAAIREY